MIKRILLCYDTSSAAQSALSIASNIAGIVDAELIGLFVEDESRFMELSLASAIAENVMGQLIVSQPLRPAELLEEEEKVEQEKRNFGQHFEQACVQAGIEGRFVSLRGVPEAVIAERAKTVDFVVLGKREKESGVLYLEPGRTATSLLKNTTRPVLVVPEEPVGASSVLIAYDGSMASERALAAGAQFAEITRLKEVHLLTVHNEKEAGQKIQQPALEYLSGYDLRVVPSVANGKVHEIILSYAEDVDASAVVLGAFGSNKIKEMIFGSTTRKVLTETREALLLVS